MNDHITGDTHGDHSINKLNSKNFPDGKLMTKENFVIVAGDFGLLWKKKESDDEDYWLTWLQEKPWTTLFIDGNHENFDRINALPKVEMFGSVVGKVRDGIYHLLRGHVYTINGKKYFIMGGGKSIDKIRRIEGISWWKEEEPNFKEWMTAKENLEAHNYEVDYVITHDIHDAGYEALFSEDENYYKDSYELPKNLEYIRQNLKYKWWYCGHHHQDREFKELKTTIVYNKIIPIGGMNEE